MIAPATMPVLSDPRFGKLPPKEKRVVLSLVAAMRRIDEAENKTEAFIKETRCMVGGRWFSPRTLANVWREKWVQSGRNWSSLVNRARVPWFDSEKRGSLPDETVCFWHELCHRFGGDRRHKAAWRELERMWKRGEVIPGFEGARGADLPRGLSYDTLMRPVNKPTKFADKVASVGIVAASDFRAKVLTTRAGLRVGERYVYDDMWHDHLVAVPGQLGSRRLLQFHCLDLLSGCSVARGYRPEILNDTTGRMERLKAGEMLFLLTHMLGEVGYCAEGSVQMMEHGTATVPERVERLLHDATGGKITFARGGIQGEALTRGMYVGRGKGNFKFKAALEVLGHLIHIEHSDRLLIPGQTGSNMRLNAPEELHGRERHFESLARAMMVLPREKVELLRLPFLPLSQAVEVSEAIQERINERVDHDLEGWEACGFLKGEYRLHAEGAWEAMEHLLALPAEVRGAISSVINASPALARQRKLSPREAFNKGRGGLARIPAHLVPELLGMDLAVERRVDKDGRFNFRDADVGVGEHHYDAVARDEEGRAVPLRSGEKYATFVSALNPARMHLCDAKGRYAGWVDRTFVPSKGDSEGVKRAMGAAAKEEARLLRPVVAAARPLIKKRHEDAVHNAAVLAEVVEAPELPRESGGQRRNNRSRMAQLARNAEEAAMGS